MAGSDGHPNHRLSYIDALAENPAAYDFYQVLRRFEAMHPQMPRLGEAAKPSAEPLRLGQDAELSFAPATFSRVARSRVPRLWVRFLGLFGPQGALPIHLTELARERERNFGDPTLARFADLFHHRLLLLFYRAWRQAQPTASRDRPAEDRFRTYVGALFGHGMPAWFGDRRVSADARRHVAGLLARSARNADGLAAILRGYLGWPVQVLSYCARWMPLPADQCSRLGERSPAAQLGCGTVLGRRVYDAQHQFDLRVGPLSLSMYERLLPGAAGHAQVCEWLREYLSEEFFVQMRLCLRADEVPQLQLGGGPRLGWTSWLGTRRSPADAEDLSLPVSQPV